MKKLILLAGIVLAWSGAAQAQAPVADYYSTTSKLNGVTLPAGTLIEAYDGQGVRCGLATANAGGGFLVHVYGNDPLTAGIDEGASEGETLTWKMADVTPRGGMGFDTGRLVRGPAVREWRREGDSSRRHDHGGRRRFVGRGEDALPSVRVRATTVRDSVD